MLQTFQQLPWWGRTLVWFAFFAILSLLSRHAVRRVDSEDRRTELTDYAGKTLTPIGATFGFLIGFAATMSWSAINAGQEAIDSQATATQQLVWATKSISDNAGAKEILGNLDHYLSVVVNQDQAFLSRDDTAALPSSQAFDALQHSVHTVAYDRGTTPEAAAMTSAAAALTAAQSKVSAVAQRALPPLLLGLLIAAGALLALAMGSAGGDVSRPYLMYGWALVSAIALTLILTLDGPFRGAIKVNIQPLVRLSETLVPEPLAK